MRQAWRSGFDCVVVNFQWLILFVSQYCMKTFFIPARGLSYLGEIFFVSVDNELLYCRELTLTVTTNLTAAKRRQRKEHRLQKPKLHQQNCVIDRWSLGSAVQKHPSNEHLAPQTALKHKKKTRITTLKTACARSGSSQKCKRDGIDEVRGVLRWRSVVKNIHLIGSVTFLFGFLARLTLSLSGMMELKGRLHTCVCVCVLV